MTQIICILEKAMHNILYLLMHPLIPVKVRTSFLNIVHQDEGHPESYPNMDTGGQSCQLLT